jgi:hypothetical protein
MEKALAAIHRMEAEEAEITFRSVAAQAAVSTAWLYNTKSLRDRIMKLRSIPKTPVENDARGRRLLSQERVISTLRLRIKELEEKNHSLTEQLELAYGKLAITANSTDSARRLHVNDGQTSNNRRKSLDHYR